jgi:NADH:ubiquinone oxidoreductase subunit 5 (subunit L)/multisubunit Na+/H+ antiporter MnhA subunit
MLRRIGKLRAERPFPWAAIALVAMALLAAPLPAFSQSCALCYTQAASAGARMIQALRSGILILIVPPTFMSLGMIFIVYRKRHQFRQAGDVPADDVPAVDAPGSDSTW